VIYPSVIDEGDGTYSMSYVPLLRGKHRVFVELVMKAGAEPFPGGLMGHYFDSRYRFRGDCNLFSEDSPGSELNEMDVIQSC